MVGHRERKQIKVIPKTEVKEEVKVKPKAKPKQKKQFIKVNEVKEENKDEE